jgi:hypothetical protein
VHFATSCNEVAQEDFNRAVALLHSFQFSRAIEGFRRKIRIQGSPRLLLSFGHGFPS